MAENLLDISNESTQTLEEGKNKLLQPLQWETRPKKWHTPGQLGRARGLRQLVLGVGGVAHRDVALRRPRDGEHHRAGLRAVGDRQVGFCWCVSVPSVPE